MCRPIIYGLCVLLTSAPLFAQTEVSGQLEYRPSPVDNPLKGLVPYQSDVRDKFPHSLEFNYVAYSSLVFGYDQFDWTALENLLDDIASRGHQTVLRIYLEYPGRTGIIPQFLIDDGLKVHRYLNTNTAPLPPAPIETPDYEDLNLRKSLKNFIAAFGKKYDGDPRLAFITAGLLGCWGEWHTHPKQELFASKMVQTEVMDAYEASFKITPILLRYPANQWSHDKASNADRNFGYHDDSFAWSTLDTNNLDEAWFFIPAIKSAGPKAIEKWKTQPIGGEIAPEVWGEIFDATPQNSRTQNFRQCIEETHVSWLMDSGIFGKGQSPARINNAKTHVRRMGYEFYVSNYKIRSGNDHSLEAILEVENRGVAPFYYNWKVEWGILSGGTVVKSYPANIRLRELLPDAPKVWKDILDVKGMPKGEYTLAIRVVNPLDSGKQLQFANTSQNQDVDGWLSIASVSLP